MSEAYVSNPELELARKYVTFTNKNIFLTGKAGTGKTTFLRRLQQELPKQMVIVAPTGVAAINAGGVTIHSFFLLPFYVQVPNQQNVTKFKLSQKKQNIIRSLDLLIIDEISMVRADVLDAVDNILRTCRKNSLPFGGVQLLMIGDVHQLSPIAKEDELQILKEHYSSTYFFHSHALNKTSWTTIELQHIYRQKDEHFITLLNNIRNGNDIENTLNNLNKQYDPTFKPRKDEGWIYLTTHNRQADKINEENLAEIDKPLVKFEASITGEFSEQIYPTPLVLEFKLGTQVMFVKNHPDKRYFNGKIGKIIDMQENRISVESPGEPIIDVFPEVWQNIQYTFDTEKHEILEEIVGTFTQFPLKLAWAITVHKSQGLTFERAIINAGYAFAAGQLYVALSRCKSLNTIVLQTKITPRAILQNSAVLDFDQKVEAEHPTHEECEGAMRDYFKAMIFELFEFRTLADHFSKFVYLVINRLSSLYPQLKSELIQKMSHFHKEFIDVSHKFCIQVEQLLTTGDLSLLQERIKKAASYFYPKLYADYYKMAHDLDIKIDNKETRELYKQALSAIKSECNLKLHCLNSVANGFDIPNYLRARYQASFNEVKVETQEKMLSKDIAHPQLYKTLEKWRKKSAEQRKVSPSVVLPQDVLLRICSDLPTSVLLLKKIKRVGKTTISRSGQDIVEMVTQYLAKDADKRKGRKEEKEDKGMTTVEKTLFYFQKENKDIDEIVTLRALSRGTICNHLAHHVSNKVIGLDRLVTPSKRDTIMKVLKQSDSNSLSNIKEVLGDEYTYEEIKFVQAFYESDK